jgi:hypothetical protein
MNNFLSNWTVSGFLKRCLLHGVSQPTEFHVHFITVTGKLHVNFCHVLDFKIPCRMALSYELAYLLICPQIQVWWMRRHAGILLKTIQCCRSHSVVMAQVRHTNYHFLWLVKSYGRKFLCKYILISHWHMNTRSVLKIEYSNFLVKISVTYCSWCTLVSIVDRVYICPYSFMKML